MSKSTNKGKRETEDVNASQSSDENSNYDAALGVYKCHLCAYKSAYKAGLKSHLTRHSSVRPFACEHCAYEAKRIYDLKKHMILRHGKKNLSMKNKKNAQKLGSKTRKSNKFKVIKKQLSQSSKVHTRISSCLVSETQEEVADNGVVQNNSSSEEREQELWNLNENSHHLPVIVPSGPVFPEPEVVVDKDGCGGPKHMSTNQEFEGDIDNNNRDEELDIAKNGELPLTIKEEPDDWGVTFVQDYNGSQHVAEHFPGVMDLSGKFSKSQIIGSARFGIGLPKGVHKQTGILDSLLHNKIGRLQQKTQSSIVQQNVKNMNSERGQANSSPAANKNYKRDISSPSSSSPSVVSLLLQKNHQPPRLGSPSVSTSGHRNFYVPYSVQRVSAEETDGIAPQSLGPSSSNQPPGRRASERYSCDRSVDETSSYGSVTISTSTNLRNVGMVTKRAWHCPHCDIMFFDNAVFFMHMGLHEPADPWQCNLCGERCHDVYSFTSHFVNQHK